MNRLFPPVEHKIYRAMALLLIFSITNVSVLAEATRLETDDKNTTTITTPGKTLFGRLEVAFNATILVNGNSTGPGTTIISGSHFQTPQFVTATVHISSVGKLDIAPQTDLILTFDQRNVEVKVVAGNAFLSTDTGIKGEVRMPDGKTYTGKRKTDVKVRGNPLFGVDDGILIGIGIGLTANIIVHWIYEEFFADDDCFIRLRSNDDTPGTPPRLISAPCNGFPKGTVFEVGT